MGTPMVHLNRGTPTVHLERGTPTVHLTGGVLWYECHKSTQGYSYGTWNKEKETCTCLIHFTGTVDQQMFACY